MTPDRVAPMHAPRSSDQIVIVAPDVLEHLLTGRSRSARGKSSSPRADCCLYPYPRTVDSLSSCARGSRERNSSISITRADKAEKYLEASGFQKISRRCVTFIGPLIPLVRICAGNFAATPARCSPRPQFIRRIVVDDSAPDPYEIARQQRQPQKPVKQPEDT